MIVSFDEVSLYKNIPINKAIEVVKCITNPNIAKLVEICLTSTSFNFDGEFYKQTCDVAMGSPLPPAVANFFIEDLESKALASVKFKPKLWKRFVH